MLVSLIDDGKDRTQTFQPVPGVSNGPGIANDESVSACGTRDSYTVQAIGELDAIINEEATKWEGRLVQERHLKRREASE